MQVHATKRTHSESQSVAEAPVVKKQKTIVIKKDQPVADASLRNSQDLFDQSDSSKSKVTATNKQSLVATKVTELTKTSDKSLGDTSEKTTTSTANNNDSSTDKVIRTTVSSSKPVAAGGGRVIRIKRKKLPANKEIVDSPTTQLEKSTAEPDGVPEQPQVQITQLAL